MAGTAVSPAPVTGMNVSEEGKNDSWHSQVNACRIAAVIDRLALKFRDTSNLDSPEFYNLCLSLARGIDYAVANQEIPTRARELPLLLKQVCQRRNDPRQLAAIMVLMMSIKNACQSKWFSDRDSEELCSLANQIGSRFCSSMDFSNEPSSSQTTISTIMTRFYPRLKMGQILVSLDVKPGFGAYVRDFQISKEISPGAKVRLLVAQTDNIETSSCLISPQDVNFLLNGKGVDKRTNVFMETGPQTPTSVTHFLKYGSNLLQAVGQFNGNYVMVVAVMSELPTLENSILQDYVQPAATIVDPDSEIIEGPSRISLNCPISFKRIKTPVKGHSCKHLQCFDCDNYIDINTKRPSWRCPHCNHHVCFSDIRVDQNMVKASCFFSSSTQFELPWFYTTLYSFQVLKDVGKNVNDVIISSDGSWKAIMESDDHTEKQPDKYSLMEKDEPEEPDSAIFSNTPPVVLDLTETDDVPIVEAEDRKVFPNNSQAQHIADNGTSSLLTTNEVNQNLSTQTEDNFWTGIYLSTFGSVSLMSDELHGGIPEYSPTNALVSPVLGDANSPTPDHEAGAFHGNDLVAISGPRNEISSQSALQLQPHQLGNSSNSNEYGRSLSTARYVSRAPVAVQALPAQAPTTVPQRSRLSPADLMPPAAAQTSAASFSRNMERQQQFTRSHDSFQASQMASPSVQQNLYPQDRQFSSVMAQKIPGQQASNHGRVSYPSQQRLNIRLPNTMNQSPGISCPQTSNLRMPNTVNLSVGDFRSAVQSLTSQVQHGSSQSLPVGRVNGQHAAFAAQRPAQVPRASRIPSFSGNTEGSRAHPVGDQRGGTVSMTQSATRLNASGNAPTDQDWRPSGRMRGSLTGRAYDALSQYIIQPTQPTQTTRAPSTPIPPDASSQLQLLLANRAALQAAGNPTALSSMSGGSGVLHPRPSDMN